MGVMEIVLILLGIIAFIGSFLLPAGKKSDVQQGEQIDEEAIRELVGKEVEEAKSKIGDIVDETITYAMEKTERSMDRLTNEKMLAVNEYSDTVLEEINKNHKEVVFLYDMLNDKHENLKTTVTEAAQKVNEVKQTVKDAEAVTREAEAVTKEAEAAAKEAEAVTKEAGAVAKEAVIKEDVSTAKEAEITAKKAESIINESIRPEEKAENLAQEVDFSPIKARRVEVIYQPEEEYDVVKTEEEPQKKTAGKAKTTKGTRAAKSADKAEKAAKPEKAEKSEKAAETKATKTAVDTAEIEVTLNAAGRTGGRNSNERILELHKAGRSNMAIAKELGLGIGEVKLVIDLFEGQ